MGKNVTVQTKKVEDKGVKAKSQGSNKQKTKQQPKQKSKPESKESKPESKEPQQSKPETKEQQQSKPESNQKVVKSSLKSSKSSFVTPVSKTVQFRIYVGSYEHNLLCLSLIMDPSGSKEPLFQPIFHFQAHSLSIKSIDLAKRYLVTGSNDEHIRIYDLQKRKELGNLLSHQGTVTTLKFSNEGNASDTQTTEKSGKWLLSGSEDGKIIIWRTKDWETFSTLKGHQGKVNDLDIHPTGRVAISVSEDHTIRLWNLMTAKKAAVLKIRGKDHLGESGEFVRWVCNGSYFIVGMMNKLLVYNTSSAKIVKKIKFDSTLMTLEIVNIDNKEWLFTGHSNGTVDAFDLQDQIINNIPEESNEAKIWDSTPESITPVYQLRGHTNRIKGLSFFNSPSETDGVPYLVSVSSDGKIVVWNIAENVRDQVAIYDTGERLNCVVTSPESVEKVETMKRRFNSLEELHGENDGGVSESEYETDGEEIRKIMMPKSKKGKKNKKSKVTVTLED